MNVLVEVEKYIARVTINRPEALNALNGKILSELKDAVEEIGKNKEIRAVLFQGSGEKSFVAGADIAEMAGMNPLEAREFSRLGQGVFAAISRLKCPTIAVIQGFALGGGCELALACDLRIASEKAKFGQPEVGLGIFPGFGGTQRLARLVGPGRAKLLIFTGNVISAGDAYGMGLVDKVVPAENLKIEAITLADSIAAKSPNAITLAKTAIDEGFDGSVSEGMELEAGLFGLCFASKEQKVGMEAFLEKRKADF
jgi:enoyl-CoA hydratase